MVPMMAYAANSAWRQMVVLVHNLLMHFQTETGATRRPPKRTRTVLRGLPTVQILGFVPFRRARHFVCWGGPYGEPLAFSRDMDEQRHPEVGGYRADGQYWSVRRTTPAAVLPLTIIGQEKLATTSTTAESTHAAHPRCGRWDRHRLRDWSIGEGRYGGQ